MYAFRTALRPIGLFVPEFATLQLDLSAIADLLVSSKIALLLKKVCYKVSLCENCQRQSCRACIGRAMIGGERPLKLKFCVK